MRISKEIQEFASGKDPASQPSRRSLRSPGPGTDGRELLARRAASLPKVAGQHACHSDLAASEKEARDIQEQRAQPSAHS
jgi:hypothetical protein